MAQTLLQTGTCRRYVATSRSNSRISRLHGTNHGDEELLISLAPGGPSREEIGNSVGESVSPIGRGDECATWRTGA